MESKRRQHARASLGLDHTEEDIEIEEAKVKEESRKLRKESRKEEIEESSSYQLCHQIAKVMDKYYLDPIIGLIPGVGNLISSIGILPYLYVALFKVRSISLTLAIIYNTLIDALVGYVPFYLGTIIDIFNRSYLRNVRLITGFVEDKREVIREVNEKAAKTLVLIIILCILIYYVIKWTIELVAWIKGLFA